MNFAFLKSKTVWGAIGAALAFLAQPEVLAVLPEKWSSILIAVFGLLTAIGVRDAIAKNGSRE